MKEKKPPNAQWLINERNERGKTPKWHKKNWWEIDRILAVLVWHWWPYDSLRASHENDAIYYRNRKVQMRENQCAVIRMEYNDPEWLIDMIKFIGCNYTPDGLVFTNKCLDNSNQNWHDFLFLFLWRLPSGNCLVFHEWEVIFFFEIPITFLRFSEDAANGNTFICISHSVFDDCLN